MQLGFKGKTQWLDASDFLVHFTKGASDSDAYNNMLSILGSQMLTRGQKPFGIASSSDVAPPGSQKSVCFSEVPLGFLDRIAGRRSKYGIGFRKRVLSNKGAAPVWYLEEEGVQAKALRELMRRETDPSSTLWQLTPHIDELRGNGGPGTYRFEWEREWRLNGDLHFSLEEVAFLLMDETFHEGAREFFDEAEHDQTGPCYTCPFIDSSWDVQTVQQRLQRSPVSDQDNQSG